MKTAVINGIIITLNSQDEVIRDGYIAFEDENIMQVGKTPADLTDFDEVIDARGNIVMPGLINTHGHTPMSLLRGYGDDLPLERWLTEKMWPIEGQFREEDIRLGAELAIIEMLKSGTTTYSDFYIYMDTIAEVVRNSGIRANLSRGIIGSDNQEENKAKLNEAIQFAKEWEGKAEGRITTMLSPHSIYTCSSEVILDIIAAISAFDIPVQTHLSETKFEVEQSYRINQKSPVRYLDDLGFFDNHALIAHAVHLSDEDLMILKNREVHVSHNPGSNLKLGSGIAPIDRMIEKEINVSLGTDSAASNNNLDMFEEMRLASLLQKGLHHNTELISADIALRMGTINGSKALNLSDKVGSLEVGKKADFIILDTKQAHLNPLYNPISQIIYAANGQDVNDTFVNGKQVVKDKKIITLDEERVISNIKQLTKKWINI